MSEKLFQKGESLHLRPKDWLIEDLNHFAVIRHIDNKTDCLHDYIKALKGSEPPTPQPKHSEVYQKTLQAQEQVDCPYYGRKIYKIHCDKIRTNLLGTDKGIREKICDMQPCSLKDAKV